MENPNDLWAWAIVSDMVWKFLYLLVFFLGLVSGLVGFAGFTLGIFYGWFMASVFWSVIRWLIPSPSVVFGGEWSHDT